MSHTHVRKSSYSSTTTDADDIHCVIFAWNLKSVTFSYPTESCARSFALEGRFSYKIITNLWFLDFKHIHLWECMSRAEPLIWQTQTWKMGFSSLSAHSLPPKLYPRSNVRWYHMCYVLIRRCEIFLWNEVESKLYCAFNPEKFVHDSFVEVYISAMFSHCIFYCLSYNILLS